ncbi:unnamed protein product [Clonostachys chloroleuca]|uniref:Uncharacterized protein n=1 Tax=Clonostachys chloroleuca TaxID=1926264 RepID=A0AA35Q286_9HYPO|nr:unnamed protein product [Clonostachys chloroleuca]
MATAKNGGDILFEDPVTLRKSLPSPPRLVETEEDAALRAQIAILLHIDSYCIRCLEWDRPERRGEPRLCQGYSVSIVLQRRERGKPDRTSEGTATES